MMKTPENSLKIEGILKASEAVNGKICGNFRNIWRRKSLGQQRLWNESMELPDTKNSLAALIHHHLKDIGRHLRSHPGFKKSEDTEDVFRHLLERPAEVETD